MTSEVSSQKKTEYISKSIELLTKITTIDDAPAKEFRLDPIGASLKAFQQYILTDCSISGWFASAFEVDTSLPECDVLNDSRVRYARILNVIYDRLTTTLVLLRDGNREGDEFTILSVQQIVVIASSIQFYLLTQCLPFLDDGVGIAVQKRSDFIKTWKGLTSDIKFQREQLTIALAGFKSLLECNKAVKTELIKFYLHDIICCYEQLIHIGGMPDEIKLYYEKLYEELPKKLHISVMMELMKHTDLLVSPPQWFTGSLGRKLSEILISENGLRHTLDAYLELCDRFWDNSFLLSFVGKQLATPPFSQKKNKYYINIVQQLMSITSKKIYPDNGMGLLFSYFADQFDARTPSKCSLYFLDPVFKPWELIMEIQSPKKEWDSELSSALSVLAIFCDKRYCPKVISRTSRFVQALPLFLCLLASACNMKDPTDDFVNITNQIKAYLNFTIELVENKGQFLMNFVRDNHIGNYNLKCSKQKKLVVVVEEEDSEDSEAVNNISIEFKPEENDELSAMARLESVIQLIKCQSKDDGAKLIIDVLCESVGSWSCLDSTHESPRFVALEKPDINGDWSQFTSHLLATFCFEQISQYEIDGSDSTILQSIMKFVKIVLISCRASFDKAERTAAQFDVINRIDCSDLNENSKMFQLRINSVKMAIGLASSIITAEAFCDEASTSVRQLACELSYFAQIQSRTPDMSVIKEQAHDLVKIVEMMTGEKIEYTPTPAVPEAKPKKSMKTETVGKEIRRTLSSDEPALLGHALLRIAQGIRRREREVVVDIDKWILDAVKKYLIHEDSYVYLNAINALAEIASYHPKYLTILLELVATDKVKMEKMSEEEQTLDVVMRSHLACAMGKVFKVMGDAATLYLDDCARVFIKEMIVGHDVTRASAFTVFSDLVLACRGRQISKYFIEIYDIISTATRPTESKLIRRSAILLLRQYIRSCDSSLITICSDSLRDLRRWLVWIWQQDEDHVMRLHAELCCDHIRDCLEANIQGTLDQQIRTIRI